jgi:hypothetical protein
MSENLNAHWTIVDGVEGLENHNQFLLGRYGLSYSFVDDVRTITFFGIREHIETLL